MGLPQSAKGIENMFMTSEHSLWVLPPRARVLREHVHDERARLVVLPPSARARGGDGERWHDEDGLKKKIIRIEKPNTEKKAKKAKKKKAHRFTGSAEQNSSAVCGIALSAS